jgi:hypothetical protein
MQNNSALATSRTAIAGNISHHTLPCLREKTDGREKWQTGKKGRKSSCTSIQNGGPDGQNVREIAFVSLRRRAT